MVYRGIALQSCLYKIFTGLLYKRLRFWVDVNGKVPCEQFRFRRGSSTLTAANLLKNTISDNIANKGYSYCCFIDFQKAFDCVNRQLLIWKLSQMDINGDLIHLMRNMFSIIFFQVVSDNYVTEPINQSKGVPQVDKLSPLIFSLFIADLSDYLKGNEEDLIIIFYAGDLDIVSKTLSTLQMAMERLQKYCTINKLEVNVGKTEATKFRRGGRLSAKDILTYNGIGIKFVKKFLYLGIVFTHLLRPTAHLAHLKKKSSGFNCLLEAKSLP